MVCANPITLICPVMPTVAYSITKMEIPHAVGQGPQIREQILVPDLYVLTVESAAYKKRLRREKKNSPPPKKKLTLFYATFQCGRYNVKKNLEFFFCP